MNHSSFFERQPNTRNALTYARIPEYLWPAKWAEISEPAKEQVRNYLRALFQGGPQYFGVGLFIHGLPGTGKSAVASVVLQELRARGLSSLFITAAMLRDANRSQAMFEEEQSMWERVCTVQVLVIDNLRAEDVDDKYFGATRFEDLVVTRASSTPKCFTFFTSQMSPRVVDEKYPGLASTMEGRLLWLEVSGKNWRRNQAQTLSSAMLGVTITAAEQSTRQALPEVDDTDDDIGVRPQMEETE